MKKLKMIILGMVLVGSSAFGEVVDVDDAEIVLVNPDTGVYLNVDVKSGEMNKVDDFEYFKEELYNVVVNCYEQGEINKELYTKATNYFNGLDSLN